MYKWIHFTLISELEKCGGTGFHDDHHEKVRDHFGRAEKNLRLWQRTGHEALLDTVSRTHRST
jgi:hypothetical protein